MEQHERAFTFFYESPWFRWKLFVPAKSRWSTSGVAFQQPILRWALNHLILIPIYIEVSLAIFFTFDKSDNLTPLQLFARISNQNNLQKEEPKEFSYSEYRKRLEEVVPQLLTGRFPSFICISFQFCLCISIYLCVCICICPTVAHWKVSIFSINPCIVFGAQDISLCPLSNHPYIYSFWVRCGASLICDGIFVISHIFNFS